MSPVLRNQSLGADIGVFVPGPSCAAEILSKRTTDFLLLPIIPSGGFGRSAACKAFDGNIRNIYFRKQARVGRKLRGQEDKSECSERSEME